MSVIGDLLKSGDKEGAMRWIDSAFESDPDSAEAAYYFAHLMLESGHPGPAKFMLESLIEKFPEKWQAWQHYAQSLHEFEIDDEAEKAFLKCLDLNPDAQAPIVGLANIYTVQHEWEKAKEYSLKALSIGESIQAEINLAFTALCEGDFAMGWDLYSKGMGKMLWRDKHDYGLKDWDGEDKSVKLLIYPEQGIGDQIAFSCCMQEAIDDGLVVAINCNPKLKQLFSDSFSIPVYGDQFTKECRWVGDTGATHQASMSDLIRHYRRSKESFTGKPYLKANPDKIHQWKALLARDCPGLKVGICWTGGYKKSHAWKRKNMDLEGLKDLLQIPGVDWVCLEYKDRGEDVARIRNEQGLIIRDWPWGTQTSDYGDTAALVSALDLLITVPTSVNHLAGALGKEVHCLMHERPHFHYTSGMPYYSTVNLYDRATEMDKVRDVLLDKLRQAA